MADASQAPYGTCKTWKVLEFYFDISKTIVPGKSWKSA